MTRPVTDELKDIVIRKYLQDIGRNETARDTGLGTGTVTNIIQEFNDKLAEYEPEAIRELTEKLRKAGISPNDCVRGSQMVNKMSDLGIDKDKCLTAIEIIQTRSIEKGVTPEKSAEIVSQLFKISKSESIPLDEIPDYVRQKLQEKGRLDTEVDIQQRQIQNLKVEADTLLQQNNLTMQNIGSYLALKHELANVGIPEADIDGATNVIRNFHQQGFDANKIVQKASTTMSLEQEVIDLSNQCLSYKKTLSPYQHWVPLIQAIIEVGGDVVGPNELRVLVEIICWRAKADNVSTIVAASLIVAQLHDMYRIIGFEKEIKTKELGLKMLEQKIQEINELWVAKLQAIDALTYLAAREVTKEHVIQFHNFFRTNRNRINLTTLVADLERYGSMKHTLNQLEEDITERTNQSKSLHMETISLHHDRDNIEKENAFMSMKVDSLKKQTSRLTSELNSLRAKVALQKDQKEKGRVEKSPRAISDP